MYEQKIIKNKLNKEKYKNRIVVVVFVAVTETKPRV